LFSTVWKIKCAPGDTIESGAQALIILEAMKTEIPVLAGEENVGKRVRGLGEHVAEGSAVRPGDILVVLE
jgi:biotin carboxyl carrier protein